MRSTPELTQGGAGHRGVSGDEQFFARVLEIFPAIRSCGALFLAR